MRARVIYCIYELRYALQQKRGVLRATPKNEKGGASLQPPFRLSVCGMLRATARAHRRTRAARSLGHSSFRPSLRPARRQCFATALQTGKTVRGRRREYHPLGRKTKPRRFLPEPPFGERDNSFRLLFSLLPRHGNFAIRLNHGYGLRAFCRRLALSHRPARRLFTRACFGRIFIPTITHDADGALKRKAW